MSKQTKNTLKSYFKSGEKPTQGKYQNLIDSALNLEETGTQSIKSDINITGSLNVLSSAILRGDITSSGNISSSGEIKGSNLSGTNTGDQDLSHLATTGSNINFANITSSNNVSASGEIVGSNLSGTNTGDQDLSHLAITGSNINFANITSSGTISSSGTVTAASFVGDGSGLTNITITSRTESISLVTASIATGSLIISGSDTYTSGSTTMLLGLRSSGSLLPGDNRKFDLGEPDSEWQTAFIRDLKATNIISNIITQDIIPDGDNTRVLGSSEEQYRILHATTASVARIDSKFADNEIFVSGSFVPVTDDVYDLGGGFAEQWRDLWIDGTAHIDTLGNSGLNFIFVSSSLIPNDTSFWDLGSSDKLYKDIYIGAFAHIDTLVGIPSAPEIINISSSLIPFNTGSATHGWDLGSSTKGFHRGYIRSSSVDYISSFAGVPANGTNTGIGSSGGVATGAIFEQRVIISGSLVPHGHLMYDLGAPGTDSSGGDPHPTSGITGTARQWRNLYLEGTASLNNIEGDPDNNQVINISASFVPSVNNVFNFGSPTNVWNTGYFDTGSISYLDVDILDVTGGFILSNLTPLDDNKTDLGSRNNQWKTGHISSHSLAWITSKENFGESNPPTSVGTPVYVNATLEPGVDSLYSLGSSTSEWHFIYIDGYAHLDGIANENSNIVGISASLIPNDDNIWDLGGSGSEYKDIYINGNAYIDTLKNITWDGNVLTNSDVGIGSDLIPIIDEFNKIALGNNDSPFETSIINTASFGFIKPKTGDGYDTKLRISSSIVPFNNPNISEFDSASDRWDLGSVGDERWGDLFFDPPSLSAKIVSNLESLIIETETGKTIRTGSAFIVSSSFNNFIGGSDTQVQFNDNGELAGDTGFLFIKDTNSVFVEGNVTSSGHISASGTGDHNFGGNVIVANNIIASGDISASGELYISASENNNTSYKILVHDTATGRVYYTGSYADVDGGGGGGSTSPAGSNTQVQFNNSGEFGADADFIYNSTTNILSTNGGFSATSGGVTASGDLSASGDLLLSGHISQSSTETNYFGGSLQLDNNKYINSLKTDGSIVNVIGTNSSNKIEIAPSDINSVIIPTSVTASYIKTAISESNHLLSFNVSNAASDSTILGTGNRLIVSMSQLPIVENVTSADFSDVPIGTVFVHGGTSGIIGGLNGVDASSGKIMRFLGIVTDG